MLLLISETLILFCFNHEIVSETVASTETRSASDRWWIPIGVLALLLPIQASIAIAVPPDAYTGIVLAPISILGVVLTILSPLFVHFDRRYLQGQSAWEPSGWYYWMILPPLTLVLPILYIYQRHRQVGVP